ncbi:TetR family transcriptional regulator [Streptomyces sp. RP5T]|uniref:TetR family transcriptional regulator n=1 Tax=Streptomyces sp. RP5T TaxID=2490848 RepID=UPI000F6539B2|nr:TetR family transcriptional regulator [Streptomyces sp. RP5T]RRR87303.1 TetR/AcrR family transcriptional regulator [Streptomyces sp. RP5T]
MTRYRESVRSLLKERILDAAHERVAADGWDRLKMTHIATTAGVSRQTVYTEYGSKAAIGQALVMREVERFLTGIQGQLLAHPDDMRAAITAAIGHTLRTAADNSLLKAILTSSRGGDEDLLAHLTTRSEPLLDTAISMLTAYATEVWPDIDAHSRDLAVESVVRLTVSHLVQPTLPPDLSAERIAEITMRVVQA